MNIELLLLCVCVAMAQVFFDEAALDFEILPDGLKYLGEMKREPDSMSFPDIKDVFLNTDMQSLQRNMFQVLREMVTLWCALVLLLAAASGSEAQCSGSTSRVEFTVTSVKNGTTHRDVAVSLLSEVPADSQESQPVALKVAHWTQRCGGTETVAMNISTASSILAESGRNTTSVGTAISGVSSPRFLSRYQKISGFGEYKVHGSRVSWALANRTCVDEGAHLVVMETMEERNAVNEMVRSAGPSFGQYSLWTGVYRDDSSSPWMTVLGRRLGRSAHWSPGYPKISGDCIWFLSTDISRGDSNLTCEAIFPFLCEKQ